MRFKTFVNESDWQFLLSPEDKNNLLFVDRAETFVNQRTLSDRLLMLEEEKEILCDLLIRMA